MPVIKSAKKKLRKDIRREKANLKVLGKMKKTLKDSRKTLTPKKLSEASKAIDKAAKKNIIHKNKAARLKSRLYKLTSKSNKK